MTSPFPVTARYLAIDQGTNASQVASLTGFFNSQGQASKQYEDGVFVDATNTIGLKIGMSQNIARQTVGPLGGTPVVNGAAQVSPQAGPTPAR